MDKEILVLGGTGKTGRRIAHQLRSKGIPVRIASRAASQPFHWSETSTWKAALDNVDTVYLSYAPDLALPGAPDTVREFVNHAITAGVKRLVLLSGRGEEEAQTCERIVQETDLEWTIVRASWFMQNFSEGDFTGMVLDGAITLPAADIPEPFIDINDIADVAVAALTEEGHTHEIYEVTGPRLMTFTDLAREISDAAMRPVRFIQISSEAFAHAIAQSGATAEVSWLLNYLFDTVLDGRNAYLGDGVQRALGREPADFSTFAKRIAERGVWDIDSARRIV